MGHVKSGLPGVAISRCLLSIGRAEACSDHTGQEAGGHIAQLSGRLVQAQVLQGQAAVGKRHF